MTKAKTKTKARTVKKNSSSPKRLAKPTPALVRAQRITERASRFGFDWPAIEPVWEKVEEELRELRSEAASGAKERIRAELGDLLFSLVNLSRFLGVEAEAALDESNDRFLKRFRHIERRLRQRGKSLTDSTLEEMDALWEEAKRAERER